MQPLKETDFNWHAQQPDVPNMTAQQMKAFLDAPIQKLMDKLNESIDLLNTEEAGQEQLRTALSELEFTLGNRIDRINERLEDSMTFDAWFAPLRQSIAALEQAVQEQQIQNKEVSEALEQLRQSIRALEQSGGGTGAAWEQLYSQNGERRSVEELSVSGLEHTRLRGVWWIMHPEMTFKDYENGAFLCFNGTTTLNITDLCSDDMGGEESVSDMLFELELLSFAGIRYIRLEVLRAPSDSTKMSMIAASEWPSETPRSYLIPFEDTAIRSLTICVKDMMSDLPRLPFKAAFELEGQRGTH